MKRLLAQLDPKVKRTLALCFSGMLIACMLLRPAPTALAQSSGDDVPIEPAQVESSAAVRTELPGPGVTSPDVTPGLVELPGDATQPQQPIDPASIDKLKPVFLPLLSKPVDQMQASATLAAKSLDMKLLVIAADGLETDYPYIRATLDQLGIPYDVLLSATDPLTPEQLSDGADHGYYQGVILVTGNLSYSPDGGTTWVSGFDASEWATLWAYEATFGVRQVTSYTYPEGWPDSYGLTYAGFRDTTTQVLTATFTAAGSQIYADLNTSNPVTFTNAWIYLGTVANTGVTTPLLTTPQGYAIASITTYPGGRQNLAITAANNPYLIHSLQLAYGTINWLTKGMFLGYRKAWINPQIDDLLIDSDIWDTTALSDTTGRTYRLSGTDFTKAITWQSAIRTKYPLASSLTYEWAFNGEGASGIYRNDSLTPAVRSYQGQFTYVSHTYTHLNLDSPATYQEILTQLRQNHQTATNLRFTRYFSDTMVQPDISGLYNPEFIRAAKDFGIKYMISDTSRPTWNNPKHNAGFDTTSYPVITMTLPITTLVIPRRPTNLFYNLSTPAEWVSEYNCFYGPSGTCAGGAFRYWPSNLTYAQILDKESDLWLKYLLKWDIDPLMFHQANVRAYPASTQYPNPFPGNKTLLGDLIDSTLAKYSRLSKAPIQFLTQRDIGIKMTERNAYNLSGVTATMTPCTSITLRAANAARVPITGVAYGEAANREVYLGQSISYVNLVAGQSLTVPLPACN